MAGLHSCLLHLALLPGLVGALLLTDPAIVDLSFSENDMLALGGVLQILLGSFKR